MPNTQKQKKKNNVLKLYLDRHQGFDPGILSPPSPDLSYCIIIPCYNEPNVINTIQSVFQNNPINKSCEIIVVVNSPQQVSEKILQQNALTIRSINKWKENNQHEKIKVHTLYYPDLPLKKAGAGLARKIGMDEAIHRFSNYNNPEGIIINLDADTICEMNYLSEIDKFYSNNPKADGCNIHFEHNLNKIKDPNLRFAIAQYELYLRYYAESLRTAGYPYFFHTIGSCFSVKAGIYCKVGGMSPKQAGEDFYFLQKVFQLGHYHELNTTCVYPEARISERVIFGTGAAMGKLSKENKLLLVYSFQSFLLFKSLFKLCIYFYHKPEQSINEILLLPEIFVQYLNSFGFQKKLYEIKENTSNEKQFRKRLYQYFNNFFIIKGLNFLSRNGYYKLSVMDAVKDFYKYHQMAGTDNLFEMLESFRLIQKQR